ncbi:putative bifunctional UDP-N-acetylglucosamine transferase and deubiquitinase ALG13 [Paramacrobiotus metropolitanus]|uniref:putative bifunctional UDP-N-acetylglucosamine transferase and deubiquitinase ALG13 n=1 Tax=Paramacrobiotus metropolitanus TaxID=2943436 RepID=UPI0024459A93|nr:putative bifunctional UDP-N-acetylglucosamine transferase and deubiquitinase ALG13 [Paramacrobiotus metropolitanus]
MSGRFGNKYPAHRYEGYASRSSLIKKHRQPREKIDYVLDSAGWYRKRIPKDASCLFRVVSEQVFQNQVHFAMVRKACIRFMKMNSPIFSKLIPKNETWAQYLEKLQSEETAANHPEMLAMSILYKRDFIVYHHSQKEPENKTNQGFDKHVTLCMYGDNHYDSVLQKEELTKAGIAQAIVYDIQYCTVFKLGKAVDILTNHMLKEPQNHEGFKRSPSDGRSELSNEDLEAVLYSTFREKGPPFPYKIAKSFKPHIYRNVDFDVWIEDRKRTMKQEQERACEEKGALIPGSLCWINRTPDRHDNWGKEWGVVQKIDRDQVDSQTVTGYFVYVVEIGETEKFTKAQLKYKEVEEEYTRDPYAKKSSAPDAFRARVNAVPFSHRGRLEFRNRNYYDARPGYHDQNRYKHPGPGRDFSVRCAAPVFPAPSRFPLSRMQYPNRPPQWNPPVPNSVNMVASERLPMYAQPQFVPTVPQGFANFPSPYVNEGGIPIPNHLGQNMVNDGSVAVYNNPGQNNMANDGNVVVYNSFSHNFGPHHNNVMIAYPLTSTADGIMVPGQPGFIVHYYGPVLPQNPPVS